MNSEKPQKLEETAMNQLIQSKQYFEKWGVKTLNLQQYLENQKKLRQSIQQLNSIRPQLEKYVKDYIKDKELLSQVKVSRIAEMTFVHILEYKGYSGVIEVDVEENMLCGKVIDIKDVITFKAETVEQAKIEFAKSVDDYLEFYQELKNEGEL